MVHVTNSITPLLASQITNHYNNCEINSIENNKEVEEIWTSSWDSQWTDNILLWIGQERNWIIGDYRVRVIHRQGSIDREVSMELEGGRIRRGDDRLEVGDIEALAYEPDLFMKYQVDTWWGFAIKREVVIYLIVYSNAYNGVFLELLLKAKQNEFRLAVYIFSRFLSIHDYTSTAWS